MSTQSSWQHELFTHEDIGALQLCRPPLRKYVRCTQMEMDNPQQEPTLLKSMQRYSTHGSYCCLNWRENERLGPWVSKTTCFLSMGEGPDPDSNTLSFHGVWIDRCCDMSLHFSLVPVLNLSVCTFVSLKNLTPARIPVGIKHVLVSFQESIFSVVLQEVLQVIFLNCMTHDLHFPCMIPAPPYRGHHRLSRIPTRSRGMKPVPEGSSSKPLS